MKSRIVLKNLKISLEVKQSPNYTFAYNKTLQKTLNATFFILLVDVCSFVLWIGDLFFKAVPCQRYFGGNIVMGANFLRKNVTFSATLFVAIKHPF